ncbi:MAG: hypothetical protein SGPRY_007434 [Prymnesium sp.]
MLRRSEKPRAHSTDESSDSITTAPSPPTDSCYLAYIILYLQGVGALFPWNALITPFDYFQLRFQGSPFQGSFESIFTTTFTLIGLVTIILLQWGQHYLSLSIRIKGSLAMLLAIFVVITLLSVLPLLRSNDDFLPSLSSSATLQVPRRLLHLKAMLDASHRLRLPNPSSHFISLPPRPLIAAPPQLVTASSRTPLLTTPPPPHIAKLLSVAVPRDAHELLFSPIQLLPQFSIIELCVGLSGMAVAVLTGSITSYASIFGSGAYIQAVIAGQGIAGLTIAVGNLLRSLPSVSSVCDGEKRDELTHVREVVTGAAIYFGACCFILLLCLVTFIKCERLPFTQLCLKQARSSKLATQFVAAQFHDTNTILMQRRSQPTPLLDATACVSEDSLLPPYTVLSERTHQTPVARTLWKWCLAMTLIYSVTIALFPALTANIQSTGEGVPGESDCLWSWPGNGLFGPFLFVMFNLGDTIVNIAKTTRMCAQPALQLLIKPKCLPRVHPAPHI